MICIGCGSTFTKNSNAQKYCCYQCGDKIRSKNYRSVHLEEIKDRRLERYKSEKRILYRRRKWWGMRNKAYLRQYNKKYRESRTEHLNEMSRRWYKNNRHKVYSYQLKRKSAKYGFNNIDNSLTEEQWSRLIESWEGKCAYCGRVADKLTQDHVIPLSKGWNHSMGNVVPACKSCNSRKGNKTLQEFYRYLVDIGQIQIGGF